jgi:sigma-B regulation protein RsbU (phosphoserine phosphatase)
MTPAAKFPIRLNVQAKILVLFLSLALVSLVITGFYAFSAISRIGTFAQASSQSLGKEAASASSNALQTMGEEYLLRVATDQAQTTDVLFENTNSEMDILAANAALLQNNSPVIPSIPSFSPEHGPKNPLDGTLNLVAPTVTTPPDPQESLTLAGLDDSLQSVYTTDNDMTEVYVATDSGIMQMYPWNNVIPRQYDPRVRDWFIRAVNASGQPTWSEKPYVDASGKGLVMTYSRAVQSPHYGHWVIASDVSVKTINEDFLGHTLGGNGYAVLVSRNGDIISRPGMNAGESLWDKPFAGENVFSMDDPGLSAVVKNMTAGKTGIERVWFNQTETYVAYAPVSSMNWSLAISLPVSQITDPVKQFEGKLTSATESTSARIDEQTNWFRTIFALLFLVIVVLVLGISVFLARIITKPIGALKKGTGAIGIGDLTYRVHISSGDEFEDLGNSFNSMAEDLSKNIETLRRATAEKVRYTKEMEIAGNIQTSFLPEATPDIPGFEIAAQMIPAMEIGGDFYDFIPVTGNRWAILIADVSGKGVSAALFMAMTRTLLRAGIEGKEDVLSGLKESNRLIARDTQSGMFVTAYSAVLDPEKMTLSCTNAGHNPPLIICDATGEGRFLSEGGMAIGVDPEMLYEGEIIRLHPGDYVIFYTDGVTEAFTAAYEPYGEERLIRVARRCRGCPAQDMIREIIADMRTFTGSAPQSDDITLIVLHVVPAPVLNPQE